MQLWSTVSNCACTNTCTCTHVIMMQEGFRSSWSTISSYNRLSTYNLRNSSYHCLFHHDRSWWSKLLCMCACMCVHACVDTCLHMNKQVQAWRPSCSHMCYFVCRHAPYSLRTSSCDCWFHHDRSWWSKISCTRTCVRAVVCGHLLTHEQASTSMETSMLIICSFASIHAHTACKTAVVNACFSMINHCDRTFHLHVHACVRLCVDTCWHMNKGLQACRPACTHICLQLDLASYNEQL